MTSDIEALSMLFQEGIVNLLVQIFTLLVITIALFFYDPLLAIITLLVTLPPTLFASLWFRKVSSVGYLRVRDRIADLLSHLQESLAGIRVIAAHNRRARNLLDHRAVVGEHLDAQVNTSRANSLYAPGTEMIGIATQATLLAVGGSMAASGRITVGELAAFLLFLASFFAPIHPGPALQQLPARWCRDRQASRVARHRTRHPAGGRRHRPSPHRRRDRTRRGHVRLRNRPAGAPRCLTAHRAGRDRGVRR